MPYSTFISFSPRLHQICSSLYASDLFRLHFGNENDLFVLKKLHLRLILGSYFNLQRRRCILTKEIILQLIDTFLQTTYISNFLTHELEFNSYINASLQNFKVLAPTTTINLLELIRDTTEGNQLLTGTFNNAKLQYNTTTAIEDNKMNILWVNLLNESCNCGISTDSCQLLYDDYCNNSFSNVGFNDCSLPIKGLYLTCYLMSGMSLLSLECYYDDQCVSNM